ASRAGARDEAPPAPGRSGTRRAGFVANGVSDGRLHLSRALGRAARARHHPGLEVPQMTTNNRGPRGHHQSFSDLDKPLYTISVAAEILETHPRTLMRSEDAQLTEPHRTTTNRRRYSQRDISKVQVIQDRKSVV